MFAALSANPQIAAKKTLYLGREAYKVGMSAFGGKADIEQ
jgi:hypothetical protein